MSDAFDMRVEIERLRAERDAQARTIAYLNGRIRDSELMSGDWRREDEAMPGIPYLVAEPGCGMAVAHKWDDGSWRDCHGATIRPSHVVRLPPWPCRARGRANGRTEGPCSYTVASGSVCEFCLGSRPKTEAAP